MPLYKGSRPDLLAKLAEKRWRGRTDLLWLARNCLGFDQIEEDVHRPMANKLQAFVAPPQELWHQHDVVTNERMDYLRPFVPMMELPGGRRRLILDFRGAY